MTATAAKPLINDEDAHHYVVVMAASAGGIEALQRILPELPGTFPAPIILVLHRTGRAKLLAKILGRRCRLVVRDAHHGDCLLPGSIYVAPPDEHTHITSDRRLAMHDGVKINFVRGSADPLFRSAAAVYGSGAVGVVLTGGGRNGAGGAKAIRDAGGAVICQDEASCRHFAMPKAAIDAGAATSVVPLDHIADVLLQAVKETPATPLAGVAISR